MNIKEKNDQIEPDELITVDIVSTVLDCVSETDRFLNLIHTNHSDSYEQIVRIFKQKLVASQIPGYLSKFLKSINVEFEKGSLLKYDENLLFSLKNAIISNMHYGKYETDTTDPKQISLPFSEYYRGASLSDYLLAISLCKVVSRPVAINTIRENTREYFNTTSSTNESEKEETLEIRARKIAKGSAKSDNGLIMVDEGHLYFKVQRCRSAEAIADWPDKELLYYLKCYGDYFNYQKRNKYFVLTRSKTLMKGNDYCDFCYHDRRYIEEINHPQNQFWDNLDQEFE